MILFRFTQRTILNSASLCLGVPLVVVLATGFAFKAFTDGKTKPIPKKPAQSVAKTDDEKSGETAKSSESRGNEIPSFWTDADAPSAGTRRKLTINGVEFVFCWIPAGTFMMGSPLEENNRSDDEIQHEVRISQGLWMLETEVTQGMWIPVMGDNPSRFKSSERLPVENVSWNDCQRYIRKLNAVGLCPQGLKFALPTEAQWEYACRAGTTTPYSFGFSLNGDDANCDGRNPYGTDPPGASIGATSTVGSYQANPWGLYDMHGNVAEWTADWYEGYSRYRTTDPKGPEQGLKHVYRGGSWRDNALSCRSASRASAKASEHADGVGLRLVLVKTNERDDKSDSKDDKEFAFLDSPSQSDVVKPVPIPKNTKSNSTTSKLVAEDDDAFAFLDSPSVVKPARVPQSSKTAPAPSENPNSNKNTDDLKTSSQKTPKLWTESNTRKAGYRQTITIKGVEYAFRWIPAGSFMMGSSSAENGRYEDEIAHEVKLSRGFWMLETEITQEMWESVIGNNPSAFSGSKRLPVENVSWSDCQKYVSKLQTLGVCPEGFRFALPTEAQWEYACRAGTATPFSFVTLDGGHANIHGLGMSIGTSSENRYLKRTTEVGSYSPNAWGLFDMHGNVWEWTADWYGDYPQNTVTDPRGPVHSPGVVCRGGCWDDYADNCRSARRFGSKPGFSDSRIGFRIALVPTQP